jgi:hypothetical protein
MDLPDWIKQHKEPHTDIRRIGNGFYKYEVAFVYSKEKTCAEPVEVKGPRRKPFVCWVK